MRIRQIVQRDLEAVFRLTCALEETALDQERFSQIFLDMLSSPHYHCLMAEEDGRLLGFLNLRVERQLHHAASIAEIMEVMVDPGHRGGGVGAALFSEAARIARETGCAQLEVCCNLRREHAHRFYERQGMQKSHYKFTLPLN